MKTPLITAIDIEVSNGQNPNIEAPKPAPNASNAKADPSTNASPRLIVPDLSLSAFCGEDKTDLKCPNVFSFESLKADFCSFFFIRIMVCKINNPKKDRKSTRLNSSHVAISYAVFFLHKKDV